MDTNIIAKPVDITAPPKIKIKKIKKSLKINAGSETVYVMGQHGIFVSEVLSTGEFKLIGYLDPKEFFDFLVSQSPIDSGLLSKECVYYSRFVDNSGHTNSIHILQFDPTNVTLLYSGWYDEDEDVDHEAQSFNINLPYLQFYVVSNKVGEDYRIRDVFVSCSKKSLSSLTDEVFALPLNNINYEIGNICWGDFDLQYKKEWTHVEFAKRACNLFLSSSFNSDYCPLRTYFKTDSQTVSVREWAKRTKENRPTWEDIEFNRHPLDSPEKIIKHIKNH